MGVAPPDIIGARIAAARTALGAFDLDALVVTSLMNVAYLSGFFASAAALVLQRDRMVLIGDGRYRQALENRRRECPFIETIELPAGDSYDQALVDALAPLKTWRVGFEATHLTVSRHR